MARLLRRTVYLCRRLSDQKLIIIKQIPVEQMTREERQVAVNEAKVLAMLDHPNIIEYYENFLEDKALSIVMEYAEGGTLFEYLQHRGNALLEEGVSVEMFVQWFVFLWRFNEVCSRLSGFLALPFTSEDPGSNPTSYRSLACFQSLS